MPEPPGSAVKGRRKTEGLLENAFDQGSLRGETNGWDNGVC